MEHNTFEKLRSRAWENNFENGQPNVRFTTVIGPPCRRLLSESDYKNPRGWST
jgi:hypothetical protein